ncbi:TonB-dependent receptor [Flavobacteriaceae bacterium MHTCC 0001]
MEKALITVVYVFGLVCFSQNDSIGNRLDEVLIKADKKLKRHSAGYKVTTLSDSVVLKNIESFTALLRFNTPIYLREYGSGGTASASFRGTSASNTAVVWNGVNINSVNNGQTGFNALTVSLFDAVDIRSGGGTIEYGSGAIGGTIHLTDDLKFSKVEQITNQTVFSVGSFDTYQGLYKFKLSNSKIAINAGVSYNESENNYKLIGTEFRNTNGAFRNMSLNLNGAFFLNAFSKLKFYGTKYRAKRFLSGELPNPLSANDKYQDFSHRSLLIYTNEKERFNHEAKLAYLTEEYRFFDDRTLDIFSFGKSKRILFNYNLSYNLPELGASITSYSEYESVYGKTDQISEKHRRQLSQSVVYDQVIKGGVFINGKIRKDFNSDYKVPLAYAMGFKLQLLESWFIRVNGSKNYRVPTYNDLFWPGQGNLNLVPETSIQAEVGLGYKTNNFLIDVGAFYIASKDKIVWRPNGDINRPGIWVPINLSKVNNKGLEVLLNYNEHFNKHKFQANLNYSYVSAIDKATNKQVIFVPQHVLNFNTSYSHGRISVFYQYLYSGKVYTTESNSEDFIIPSYNVGNAGMDYTLLNIEENQLTIGLKVNNVFNENYVTQPRRPMPNRSLNFNINYIF